MPRGEVFLIKGISDFEMLSRLTVSRFSKVSHWWGAKFETKSWFRRHGPEIFGLLTKHAGSRPQHRQTLAGLAMQRWVVPSKQALSGLWEGTKRQFQTSLLPWIKPPWNPGFAGLDNSRSLCISGDVDLGWCKGFKSVFLAAPCALMTIQWIPGCVAWDTPFSASLHGVILTYERTEKQRSWISPCCF